MFSSMFLATGHFGYCGEVSLVLLLRYVSFDSCGFQELGALTGDVRLRVRGGMYVAVAGFSVWGFLRTIRICTRVSG